MQEEVRQQRLQHLLGEEIHEFRQQRRTIQLATVDEQGAPNVSYAPFICNEQGYFILISQLARHARNLLANPKASFMLIEDEDTARQLFARKRLTFDAHTEIIERDTELWQILILQMKARFGDIISDLSMLQDFILFRLNVEKGLYVKGFGQAFQITDKDLIDVVRLEEGHQKIE